MENNPTFTPGQSVIYNGEVTQIENVYNDGTCTIINPDWDWDDEAECVNKEIEYNTPYRITVKKSECSLLNSLINE